MSVNGMGSNSQRDTNRTTTEPVGQSLIIILILNLLCAVKTWGFGDVTTVIC